MSIKAILDPVVLANGVSAATTVTSLPFKITSIDNIAVQLNFSGTTSNGSYAIQASLDYSETPDRRVKNAGNWTSLTLGGSTTVTNGGSYLANLSAVGFPWLRVVFTPTSGSDNLTIYLSGRQV